MIKVFAKSGDERWLLIHVEVQSQKDPTFAKRFYLYHCRIQDTYQRDLASFAILGDGDQDWRPKSYERELWGTKTQFEFKSAKLLDYQDADLDPNNPFSWLVAAHLETHRNNVSSPLRLAAKMRLVRGLYGCGFSQEKVREFFRIIDWILALNPKLDYTFQKDLSRFEEENHMPYVTSIEGIGRKLGRKQGRKQGLKEGRIEGKLEGKLETARELLKSGVDPAIIAKATGLKPEDFQGS